MLFHQEAIFRSHFLNWVFPPKKMLRLVGILFCLLQLILGSFGCCIPVKIVIETKDYADEIYWETDPPSEAFFFDFYDDHSLYEHNHCLPPSTTFTFVAHDEYGDGWNGGANSTLFIYERDNFFPFFP